MVSQPFFPQQPVQPIGSGTSTGKPQARASSQLTFNQVLDRELGRELKFSKHAQQRLQDRNITLSSEDLEKIQNAVGKAREKGARDSLILMDQLALVVSVKNNTVITAVDEDNIRSSVFTNIDSAVII